MKTRTLSGFPTFCTLAALLWLAPLGAQAEDYRYVTNNGAITITRYIGTNVVVDITNSINGLPVTTIGDWAFSNCTNLAAVTLPNSVTNIGNGAFYSCISLSSVAIPNSVTSIGDSAFDSCTSLTSVAIPDSITTISGTMFQSCSNLSSVTIPGSVTTIGSEAFRYCTSLASVTIPASVRFIPGGAFSFCTSLASIPVDPSNPFYTSVGGVLFEKVSNVLVQFPGGIAGTYAVPEGVIVIWGEAFAGCTHLTSVIIPSSVRSIKYGTFACCTSLTSVAIPNSVTNIEDVAFYKCSSLASIAIPESVISISHSAFAYCTSLSSFTIPASVTAIGNYTFRDCTSLIGVFFCGHAPESVGSGVFYGANNATVYYLPGTRGWGASFAGRPTAPWFLPQPLILTLPPDFGVQANSLGFRVSWATNATVAIDACTNLSAGPWTPAATNTLVNGWTYFTDPDWTNHPVRFYRVRSP